MFEPIKRVSASGQVMQQIQTRIFDGTYQPGDRLPRSANSPRNWA